MFASKASQESFVLAFLRNLDNEPLGYTIGELWRKALATKHPFEANELTNLLLYYINKRK